MEGDNAIRPGGVINTIPSSGPMPEQVTSYTVPGILHFIKHEWSRFEKERASWEVEKAELQVHTCCFFWCHRSQGTVWECKVEASSDFTDWNQGYFWASPCEKLSMHQMFRLFKAT